MKNKLFNLFIALVFIVNVLMPTTGFAASTNVAESPHTNSSQVLAQANTSNPSIENIQSNDVKLRPVINQPEPRIGPRYDADALRNSNGAQIIRGGGSPAGVESALSHTQFIENVGQFDDRVLYYAQIGNKIIQIGQAEFWVTSIDEVVTEGDTEQAQSDPSYEPPKVEKGKHLRVTFPNGKAEHQVVGMNPSRTSVSYLIGNDSKKWKVNVPVYDGVRFVDVYPGVDFEIAGVDSVSDWRYVVKNKNAFSAFLESAGAGAVGVTVEGGSKVEVSNNALEIETGSGRVKLPKPGFRNGESNSGKVRFKAVETVQNETLSLTPDLSSSEELPATDIPLSLSATTDGSSSNSAAISYSTYFGGYAGAQALSMAVDVEGAVYLTGGVSDPGFPTSTGAYQRTLLGGGDTFISKINPTGTAIIYSTYIGGNSNTDEARGIAVDSSGAAYITGRTFSTDFPTTTGTVKPSKLTSDDDGYVVKLAPDGTHLIYSTYIGGTGGEQGFDVTVNQTGEAYITGQTFSADFPTTSGAFRRYHNGGFWDGYIARLNATGTAFVFSSFLGGNGDDCENSGVEKECTVHLDASGNVYVFGVTQSTNFPTTLEGDMSYNGGSDAFAVKLSPDGRSLLYGTYLGGSGQDCARTCVGGVDSSGAIYISGSTYSTDFPQTLGTRLGNLDVFVTKLYTDGRGMAYSMVFGGSGVDYGNSIAVLPFGEVFVTGSTLSSDFPVAPNAFQSTLLGSEDSFFVKLNPDATSYFSTYFGGTGQDYAMGLALDIFSGAYISGWTASTDYPVTPGVIKTVNAANSIFITKFSSQLETPVKNQVTYVNLWSKDNRSDCRDCRRKMASLSQGYAGDPINTRTGAFDYSITDLSFPTNAGDLIFQRTYSSIATTVYTQPLGPGWTHNHDTRLIFPADLGGDPDAILFKSHSLNVYRYIDNGNGTYTPDNGVQGSLVYTAGTLEPYVLTDTDQSVYTFGENGKLIKWQNSQGHYWTYSYGTDGNLSRVSDDTGLHYLDFHYNPAGYLTSVSDFSGREVIFGNDAANDLKTVTDTAQQTWTYVYDTEHRLQQVIDPNNHKVVSTEYDTQGRAYRQYDGKNQLVLEVIYHEDGTAELIDGEGNTQTHNYNSRNVLYKDEKSTSSDAYRDYDANFRPTTVVDPNENKTDILWSPDGENLNVVFGAAGDRTDLFYDDLNNLTDVTDPNGYLTTYQYDGTLLTTTIDALSYQSQYTYTTTADAPQPAGLLKTLQDPLDHVTSYTYNSFGKVTSITDASNQVTRIDYDALGRQKAIHYPSGRSDWSCYDALDRMVRQVVNASGDGQTPQTDPCNSTNYQPSADTAYDRISQTRYDLGGNAIATIAPDGVITRTYFDENNRPVTVVQNLYGQAIEAEAAPVYDPAFPDRNVRTDRVYNRNGAVIATINTLGTITRTFYDAENRPEYVVQNLMGRDISVTTPPTYDPNFPDRNLMTKTVYDLAGNVIATIDPSGTVTRTYYDGDNRPVTKVFNLTNWSIEAPTPPTYAAATPDANVRYDTAYDHNGNVIATIDPLGQIKRTYYDALNQPVTEIQNLTNQTIDTATPPSYDPLHPDQNVHTDYVYDLAGNQIAVIDPNGIIQRTYYDALNRAVLVVKNLVGQSIDTSTPPVYDPAYPDRNVRTEMVYNDTGEQIASIDPNGKITRYYYDSLERVWLTVRNLTGQLIDNPTPPVFNPAYPDQNVRSEVVYDAAGSTIATITTDNKISRTYYDKLGRAVTTVENLTGVTIQSATPPVYNPNIPDQNVRTDMLYDGAGRTVQTQPSDDAKAYACYDPLGRVVKQIVNPSVSDPCATYTPSTESDMDITTVVVYDADGNQVISRDPLGKETHTQFDALGRVTAVIDPLQHQVQYGYDGNGNCTSLINANGVVTRYEYDALNRLTAVVENYRPGVSPTAKINVRTEYGYDANGNRQTIKDALSHVTTLVYDALGRQKTERDALDHGSTYGYDAAGNLTSTLDANGFTTSFDYDGLDRIQDVDYPAPDTDVHFNYDPNGLRKTVTDGSGTTTWDYDELGRVQSITDPSSKVVQYQYNGSGKRTGLTYPDLKRAAYRYDQAGRLDTVTDWTTQVTQYGYDKAGRAVSMALPNGVNVARRYDDAGRLEQVTNQSGANLLSSFAYTYDAEGNRTSAVEAIKPLTTDSSDLLFTNGFENGNFLGWGASVTDQGDLSIVQAAALTGSYGMQAVINDENSLYAQDDSPENESGYNASFQVDPNTLIMGNKDIFALFEGANSTDMPVLRIEMRPYRQAYQIRVQFSTDTNTWSSSAWYAITDAPHQVAIEWKAATAAGAGNGSVQLWIDGVSKVTITGVDNDTLRIGLAKLGAVSGLDIDTRGTLYFDNFTASRSQAWGTTPVVKRIQYAYDPLDRLDQAVYSDGIYFDYVYDAVGNQVMQRSSAGTVSNIYDAANRLSSAGGVSYTWDNNGNLLSDGARSYTYNHATQLTRVAQGANTTTFAYNGLGDRVQETVNGQAKTFVLDLNAGLTQVLNDGTNTYLYGHQRIGQFAGSTSTYFLSDALGSVRQLVNGSGAVTLSQAYQPYGSILASQVNGGLTSYGFTGEWTDDNLIYLRARVYSTASLQFIQADTIVPNPFTPSDWNRYTYGRNNPINYYDPTGHWPEWLDYLMGAGSQYADDMSLGAFSAISGNLDNNQREAFQNGRRAGRVASTTVASVNEVEGAAVAAAAAAGVLPTAGGSLAFAPVTCGGSLAFGGVVVTGEVVVAAAGTATAVYGGAVIAKIKSSNAGSGGYKFPDAKEMAKRLGVDKETFHKVVKPSILDDPEIAGMAKKIGANNPDIGLDPSGNIVLKNTKTGKVINTNIPYSSFKPSE